MKEYVCTVCGTANDEESWIFAEYYIPICPTCGSDSCIETKLHNCACADEHVEIPKHWIPHTPGESEGLIKKTTVNKKATGDKMKKIVRDVLTESLTTLIHKSNGYAEMLYHHEQKIVDIKKIMKELRKSIDEIKGELEEK